MEVGKIVRRVSQQNSFLFYFSKNKTLVSALVCLLSFSMSACMNFVENPSSAVSRSTASSGTTPDPSLQNDQLVLVSVLPSQQSAGSQYDMIGKNGQFQKSCTNSNAPCKCEYTYEQNSLGTQTVTGNVTYNEVDLIRCVNAVPSGIQSFSVRVLQTDPTTGVTMASNAIRVSLNGAGQFSNAESFVDLTSINAYVPVTRFQCRKRIYIPNPMDNGDGDGIIDPFQSEDPNILYPFNFYTTNVSASIVQLQIVSFASGSGGTGTGSDGAADWECTLTPTLDRTLHSWANPYVFSKVPCSGVTTQSFCQSEPDAKLMYPSSVLSAPQIPIHGSAQGKRRSSFWLAGKQYGVFQIPVTAPIAPGNGYRNPTMGTIGYAAKPIPDARGSTCPLINLPTGTQWVKLWPHRADIQTSKYVAGGGSGSVGQSVIACNADQGSNTSAFKSCTASNGSGGYVGGLGSQFGTFLNDNLTLTRIASFRSGAFSGGGITPEVCYKTPVGTFGAASETWNPSPYFFHDLTPLPTLLDLKGFPIWNLYESASLGAGPAPRFLNAPATILSDTQGISIKDVSPDGFVDWLFTVSPVMHDREDVNLDDAMRNPANSSVDMYRPVTYRTRGDCDLSDDTGCPLGKQVNWGLMGGGMSNNIGGSSGNVYPLCVLQVGD